VPKLDPFSGPVLLSTAADRSLRLVSAEPPHALLRNFTTPSDSALLSLAVIKEKWIIVSSMTGRLTILNPDTGDTVTSIRPHEKYATRVLYEEPYVVSTAYDKTLYVHSLVFHESGLPSFAEDKVGKIQLSTPPEALAVVSLPAKSEKALVFSRRDSTFLFYHLLQDGLPFHSERNLAPSSNSWVSYHAMSIAVNPVNPKILAVGTSSTPHMKLMLVEVDTENVLKEVFTGAPQSVYSTAVVQWRPDASGMWLNGDDGIVRGVGSKCGKFRCSLKACEGGEKVRTLWAGVVEGAGEVLVTGGFDKGLNIWVGKE
jgi:WD40 repeat protein